MDNIKLALVYGILAMAFIYTALELYRACVPKSGQFVCEGVNQLGR